MRIIRRFHKFRRILARVSPASDPRAILRFQLRYFTSARRRRSEKLPRQPLYFALRRTQPKRAAARPSWRPRPMPQPGSWCRPARAPAKPSSARCPRLDHGVPTHPKGPRGGSRGARGSTGPSAARPGPSARRSWLRRRPRHHPRRPTLEEHDRERRCRRSASARGRHYPSGCWGYPLRYQEMRPNAMAGQHLLYKASFCACA